MQDRRGIDVVRNLLQYGDLRFSDFVEVALYHPEIGYYATGRNPVGRGSDYVTSPALSAAFSFALARLVDEFMRRSGDAMSTVVDVGCGDGRLIREIAAAVDRSRPVRFYGVDRALERAGATDGEPVEFVRSIGDVPPDAPFCIISNELFDAFPFARLVQRGEHLHELWVTERDGRLDWAEREAPAEYDDYFGERGVHLTDGQFADVSLEWERTYSDLCAASDRALIVTFDYGYPQSKLFSSRARRFGTAAAYASQSATRDLLANPGEQDLTAHINFTDLILAGERAGYRTLFFDYQAKFLLALGITEHELFRPVDELAPDSVDRAVELISRRDAARRLILPDGIGTDIRVLVQARGFGNTPWTLERELFETANPDPNAG